ncbi:uncharacterized protein B0P05DRAFT_566571 [Gilbertella persicaria]|uniref:uncharacterized protein n=1 Tax=Gilbertella persicaria TaxID=101096 RepID=UPI0022209938|nr:uncharacterized protein B0P05DRAFT_566571 [Gilbertella persicaria]KAI8047219.1 hypothetical protein B0P05DRAFT_566571 [Gilbertella persicaria]
MRTSEEETLLDSEGNLYDTIAAAFMQVMASQPDPNTTTTGTNTPVMGVEYHPLSAFELTHALNTALHHDGISRRPSLPSSTVSAAQRYRGSQDFSTSEALSALVSNDLSLAALEPIQEEPLIEEKPIQSSTHYIEALATNMLLEQTKRKANTLPAGQEKKKKMRSDEPASPAAIIDELEDMIKEEEQVSMDDLVDTSQLYNRSPSPDYEQDEHYSRDLSRWQRIPIGAFRLMRSKNKLWLER